MRKSALYVFGLVVLILATLGLVILSSASGVNAARYHGGQSLFFMERQILYLGIGLVGAIACAMIDYHILTKSRVLPWFLLVLTLAALCAVFAFNPVKGSFRWIKAGPISVQPSEFAKLVTVLLVATWLDRLGWRVELFKKGALVTAGLIGLIAAPVLLEPDFGSVMVIGCVGFLLMLIAGVRVIHMLPFIGLGGGIFLFKLVTNANRMARMLSYLGLTPNDVGLGSVANIATNAIDSAAYQVNQALVAINNGGLFGVGFTQSMQKQFYLPEAHTDFIFAIGAEELGLPFTVSVLILFFAFYGLSIYIAAKATDRLGRLLVIGSSFIVFFQAMFNLGVVCRALPTKGMALPFFSYGGSNMICSFLAVGIILSVGIYACKEKRRGFIRKVVMR